MRMIVGHGIDIEELASIESAVTRHEGFAKRVLTAKEMERFNSLKGRRQIEYLAGRWSAKGRPFLRPWERHWQARFSGFGSLE